MSVDLAELEGELVPQRSSNFLESHAKGETDTQIATARRFPRSLKGFKNKAMSLATLDEETAASCFYTLPARRGGDKKLIEGESIRLAEIAAASWGNMRSQATIIDIDDKFVTARGMCWDLESNNAVGVDIKRRITDKSGRRYSDDMVQTTSQAACSIALRNAIFRVIPKAVIRDVYLKARETAVGTAETLVNRRAKMVDYFKKMGIQPDQVCARVEKPSIDDITLDDLAILIGLATAIRDGETSLDEAFPPPEVEKKLVTSKGDELAQRLKGASGDTQPVEDLQPEPAPASKPTCEELMAAIEKATKNEEIVDLVFQRAHLNETEQAAVDAAGRARKAALRGKKD
jgi:hypothetical protein